MEVEWTEMIAVHLGRIADVHERVAGALEQIAESAEVVAVYKLLDVHGDSVRRQEPGKSLREKIKQLADEYLKREASVAKDTK